MKGNQQEFPKEKIISLYSDDPEIHDLIVEFIGEMPHRIRLANEAFMRGDRLRLQFWAHQMKGGAGGYGFMEITNRAADLETALLKQQSTEEILAALLIVIDLCERAAAD